MCTTRLTDLLGWQDGTKRTNTRKDFTQTALGVVQQASGEVTTPTPRKKPKGGRKVAKKAADDSKKSEQR